MSKAVYYYYHEKEYDSPRFINVYADSDTEGGGFVSLDDNEKDIRWWKCSGPVLGATTQSGLKRNESAKRITRCAARRMLREHGLGDLEIF